MIECLSNLPSCVADGANVWLDSLPWTVVLFAGMIIGAFLGKSVVAAIIWLFALVSLRSTKSGSGTAVVPPDKKAGKPKTLKDLFGGLGK